MTNLYFISASGIGRPDRLDLFVRANSEMFAYQAFEAHWRAEDRIPQGVITPNYDLYLVPAGEAHGAIPWDIGKGSVELISSSYINSGPTVLNDGSVWDSAAGVWRRPEDPSDEASTLFAVEALISAAATGEPVDVAVLAMARSALSTLRNVLEDGG